MLVQSVILSGGSGTRLWPYSREAYPKQYLPLGGEKTLLQSTIQRSSQLGGELEVLLPMVVCNESHRFLVAEQLRQSGIEKSTILLESVGRNTAPALTISALLALEAEQDPVLLIMPSDHLIKNEAEFCKQVTEAAKLAEQGSLVTFGIAPSGPETGFGYIRAGKSLDAGGMAIDAFVEKPDEATAEAYLENGDYYWNSGMFVMLASVWLKQIKRCSPEIESICREAMEKGSRDGSFYRVDSEIFATCPSDSIDYAVMEHLTDNADVQAVVLPLDAGWSDLGSWSAFQQIEDKDEDGNVTKGDVMLKDSRNSLVYSENRLVATLGIEDLLVVETSDAVLVAHKDHAQDIKSITQRLNSSDRTEHMFHSKVHRPWGDYESIDHGPRYQVKRLTVKPGATLSLQMHHHRAEHWIVVTGTAKVTRGDDVFLLSENESTYIPLGVTHRLENPGTVTLEIIEVQSGGYLGEDDIVRFEDRYNRVES